MRRHTGPPARTETALSMRRGRADTVEATSFARAAPAAFLDGAVRKRASARAERERRCEWQGFEVWRTAFRAERAAMAEFGGVVSECVARARRRWSWVKVVEMSVAQRGKASVSSWKAKRDIAERRSGGK